MSTELLFMHTIQDWLHAPWMVSLVVLCARWMIFIIALLALGGRIRGWLSHHALKEVFWSTLLAACLAFSSEWAIGRARPFITDPTLDVLVPPPHTMSFPSAHASIAYGMAFAIFGWNRSLGIVALILADLVAVGRVAAGVHYPSDILAGLLVGVLSFTFVRLGHGWLRKRA